MKPILARGPLARRWLGAAFGGLMVLGALDALFGPVHLGLLAIIPLLLIGFYGSRSLAISTAFVCAACFALLDNDVIVPRFHVRWTIFTDAVSMALMLIAVVWTVDRLRSSEAAAASDSLTSLVSRRAVLDRARRSIEHARRNSHNIALLFVDLDRFKIVNDRFGHAVGDRVLQHVAQRLLHSVRAVDAVGRLGGDEFLIVLEDVPDRVHAERVAQSIEVVLGAPFSDADGLPDIGATVGTSVFPADAAELGGLIRTADERMYERKKRKQSVGAQAG